MVEETWEPLTNRMDNMLFSRGSVFGDFTLLLGLPPEYTVRAKWHDATPYAYGSSDDHERIVACLHCWSLGSPMPVSL